MRRLRRWIWHVLRNVLFRLDAERAHRFTGFLIACGVRLGHVPLVLMSGADPHPPEEVPGPMVWGMEFLNPVGLAAGFDKDAHWLEAFPSLGFGFVEIGTVTPLPQIGNPRPRLWREMRSESLFNRMGFNNDGAEVVARRLARKRNALPERFRVGVNVGKNKATPPEEAALDYVRALAPFRDLADYVVINVSSPNTPGLRELQDIDALSRIVGEVEDSLGHWAIRPPLLVKLAPEKVLSMGADEISVFLARLESVGARGWIVSNTLGGERIENPGVWGGWSGGRCRENAVEAARRVVLSHSAPLISVGGILSEQDAIDRLQMGAQLIQIYSGFVYQGPDFAVRIHEQIQKYLKQKRP